MSRIIGTPVKALAAALACVLISACSSAPTGRVESPSSRPATAAGEVDAIVKLLDGGQANTAKKRISAALKRDPNNPALMLLRDSISRKPEELLGPENYTYTTRPGDTMAGLALRFLGNRLKFYQLSRYNGIDQPSALRAGQVLKIPGRPVVAQPQNPERRSPPPQTIARDKPKAGTTAVPPAGSVRAANPAAASQARSAGLAALNAGRPAQAVGLLSRAASLDPGNAAIARDLARARRIAATVGSR